VGYRMGPHGPEDEPGAPAGHAGFG